MVLIITLLNNCQNFIKPKKDDSYISLSWRGMKEIAYMIRDIVLKLENSNEIKDKKIILFQKNTLYNHHTIFNYILQIKKQYTLINF